jgi:uncharacterized protein (DUF1330 family)
MPAYVIVEIDVTDPVTYQEYIQLAPATIKEFGGSYLARGGKTEILEGDWSPKRLVILQFENTEKAKKWLNSPSYSQVKLLRHKAARTNMVAIEGVE